MYVKPRLDRYGTFRELTLIGFTGASDGCTMTGVGTSGNDLAQVCAAPVPARS
jgi:hypothetical protein